MFGGTRDREWGAVGTETGNETRRVRCDWGLGILVFPDSGFLLSLTLLYDSVVVRLGPALFSPSCRTMSVVFLVDRGLYITPENPDSGTVVRNWVARGVIRVSGLSRPPSPLLR